MQSVTPITQGVSERAEARHGTNHLSLRIGDVHLALAYIFFDIFVAQTRALLATISCEAEKNKKQIASTMSCCWSHHHTWGFSCQPCHKVFTHVKVPMRKPKEKRPKPWGPCGNANSSTQPKCSLSINQSQRLATLPTSDRVK